MFRDGIFLLLVLNANVFFINSSQCNLSDNNKIDCHPEPDATESSCSSRGCCWQVSQSENVPWCFFQKEAACGVQTDDRLDCYPADDATQSSCEARGCCWLYDSTNGVPFCYFSLSQTGYKITYQDTTSYGHTALASSLMTIPYPNRISTIQFDAYYESTDSLRLKIFDPSSERYEVPQRLVYRKPFSKKETNPSYSIEFVIEESSQDIFRIKRSNGRMLMTATSQNFMYSDQFIQLTFLVPSMRLYGVGEHLHQPMYNLSNWQTLVIYTRDQPPTFGDNLYGDQPFYLMLEDDGTAHGVLLMNSNAKEVVLQPSPAVTWRAIGGILDFYIFTGPSPQDVVHQYLSLIQKPFMVPMWGLGFHLCRWGYKSSEVIQELVDGLRKANFPEETQWSDIDYMREKLDFTYDNVTFNTLPELVNNLHEHDQHFIMILDPGIGNSHGSYPALADGLKEDVYIHMANNGSLLEGKVWPGPVYYPDFTANQTITWWTNQLKSFHSKVPFNGIWIDMNEPSDFVVGSTTGCPTNNLNNPPYTPHVLGGSLEAKTICPSAQTSEGTVYNTHDLYGHSEARASFMALRSLFGDKRSMVLTRSNFVGTGAFAAHWTGDNTSTWPDLLHSVWGLINYALFGISFIGSDICGFNGNTTEELCVRWMQLGSFYPFMRNHNSINSISQDPLSFSASARTIMNNYVRHRYSILPYLYSLFHFSHANGDTVSRGLFLNYPDDSNTYAIDDQYMLGDYILIAPIVNEGQTERDVYFPNAFWFDFVSGSLTSKGSETLSISAPLDSLPVFVRGDSILVTQTPQLTIKATQNTPYIIKFYVGDQGIASYLLYLDDGITYNAFEDNNYSLVTFSATRTSLTWNVGDTRTSANLPSVSTIYVYGLYTKPTFVKINGQPIKSYVYKNSAGYLVINDLTLSIESQTSVEW